MVTLTSRAPLQHQQPKLILPGKDAFLHSLHLVGRNMVDVHTHAAAHTRRPLQRPVLVGQTAVVHLLQQVLLADITHADGLHYGLLLLTAAQLQVALSREDGAHHLRPILIVNHMYTHLRPPLLVFIFVTFCAIANAWCTNLSGSSLTRSFGSVNTK